jgi:phage baseplate assembly protein W
MAIVLGSKPVQDLTEFESNGIGITLPLRIGDVAFEQSYKTIDQVKTNIKSLLLTRRGERVMEPLLGSGLTELLFDFNDDELASRIEETITESIQQWLPFVGIENIEIEQTDILKDQNRVNISLTFRVGNSATTDSLTFTV